MTALKRITSVLCILVFVLLILSSHETHAGNIGNCHSYVLYELTGKTKVYGTIADIEGWLKKRGYRSTKDTSNLEAGDVVIFPTHSGYVAKDGITHLLGTPSFLRWEKGKNKGKIEVVNGKPIMRRDVGTSGIKEQIDIDKLPEYPYYFKEELRKAGVLKDEIRKIEWGFLRYGDTIEQVMTKMGYGPSTKIVVWTKRPPIKKPEKVRIIAPKKYIDVNEKIKLKAEARMAGQFSWHDVTSQKDTKWYCRKRGKDWKPCSPEFVQTEAGTYNVRMEYRGVVDRVSIRVAAVLKALEVCPSYAIYGDKWDKSGEFRVGEHVYFHARAIYEDGAKVHNPKGVKWDPARSIFVKEAKEYLVTARFKGIEGSYTLKGLPPQDKVQFTKKEHEVVEGNKTIDLMVERIGSGKGRVQVEYALFDPKLMASAKPGQDFELSAGSLIWEKNKTGPKPIKVTIKDDSETEEDEEFYVHIKGLKSPDVTYGRGKTIAKVVIKDDDIRGVLELAVDKYKVAEDGKEVTIKVKRKGGIEGKASVEYELSDQTATAGKDYKRVSGKLKWSDGSRLSQEITIPILDDNDPEGPETFRIVLKDPNGAKLGSKNTCVLTIEDNDAKLMGTQIGTQKASFAPREYEVNEGVGQVTVTVKRVGGGKGTFSIDYHAQDAYAEAGKDYKSTKGTLTWAPGDTSDKTFEVEIIDDQEHEPRDETIHLQLLNPRNPDVKVAMDEGVEATVIIKDNDKEPAEEKRPPTPRARVCEYLDVTPKKSVARPGDRPTAFRAIAHFDDNTTRDVTNDPRTIWKPGPGNTYAVPLGILFTESVEIVATWQGCRGTAEITALSSPISSADDVDANVPLPPSDAYKWYVFCDPQKGEVTYGEHHQPGLRVMAGPFPGQRTAEKWIRDNCLRARCTTDGRCAEGPARGGNWCVVCNTSTGAITFTEHPPASLQFIVMDRGFHGEPEARLWMEQNCPRARCTTDGRCAEGPARGGKWCVICDRNSGEVTFSEHKPDSLRFKVMAGGLLGEPEARLWLERHCPSQRCTSEGTCATSPALAPTGTDGWYVTCFLPAGKIEIGKKPIDIRNEVIIKGPLLGEPAARWWVDKNCPSWQCDTSGQCLGWGFGEIGQEAGRPVEVAKVRQGTSSEFAEIGDPEALTAFKGSEEFHRMNPDIAEWDFSLEEEVREGEQRKQQMMQELSPIMSTLAKVGTQSIQSLSSPKKRSSSGLSDRQQEKLHYMEKDPYKKYRKYQRDTAKREASAQPSPEVATAPQRPLDPGHLVEGFSERGGGMSWEECENKYCPMCAGAISLLEVSADEDCNKCKDKYWTQIKQCVSGGGSGSGDSYWKEMEVGHTRSPGFDEGPKVYYAARKSQPRLKKYRYVIEKDEHGRLAGFQIIHGPDTFMGCRRWLIRKGYWSEGYWK